jgi:hypothetical protein
MQLRRERRHEDNRSIGGGLFNIEHSDRSSMAGLHAGGLCAGSGRRRGMRERFQVSLIVKDDVRHPFRAEQSVEPLRLVPHSKSSAG